VSKVAETRIGTANYATPLVQYLKKLFYWSVQGTPHLNETNSFISIFSKSHHLIQLNQFGAVYVTPFLLHPFKRSLPPVLWFPQVISFHEDRELPFLGKSHVYG
jgi:hypothetical protein